MNRPSRTRPRGLPRALALLCAALPTAAAVAQGPCPDGPPPGVPATYFTVQNGIRWERVASFVSAFNIQFVDGAASDSARVKPCPGCDSIVARIASEKRTNCLTSTLANGDSLRFAGSVKLYSGSAPQLGFGRTNASDSVYLLVQNGTAIAMFRDHHGRAQFVTHSSSITGWNFVFHPDSNFATPQARWRKDVSLRQGLVPIHRFYSGRRHRGPAPGLDGDDEEVMQLGDPDYGWIACAAGCCQFHGSPPGGGQDEDEDGQGKPPHHGNGHRAGQDHGTSGAMLTAAVDNARRDPELLQSVYESAQNQVHDVVSEDDSREVGPQPASITLGGFEMVSLLEPQEHGWRRWRPAANGEWEETNAAGSRWRYRIERRARVNQDDGTVFQRVDNPRYEVFLPDLAAYGRIAVRYRTDPSARWAFLGLVLTRGPGSH